jgi:malonyl-CoA O-methyltransferase
VSVLETRAVAALAVDVAGRRLLDVGCGVGRRLNETDAALAVGVDVTPEMLTAARRAAVLAAVLAAADGRQLPFADATFDVVWCRLVVGHLPVIDSLFAELARVCRGDGVAVVTDLAVAAARAGHRRTFRDRDGATHEVEHFQHDAAAQIEAARACGLEFTVHRSGCVDESVRDFYAAAGRLAAYEAQKGLAIVSALSFRKRA